MPHKLTFLAPIVFVGNLSPARVPIPVPQAIQNAYVISDVKQSHFEDRRKLHWVIDSGALYTMNDNLYARTQPPLVENVVINDTLLPYHARTADHIFGIGKGRTIKQGNRYYLSKISAEKNGLVFTFTSFDVYWDYLSVDGGGYNQETGARMKIRFAMTPAQLAVLTPEAVRHMTDKFFTITSPAGTLRSGLSSNLTSTPTSSPSPAIHPKTSKSSPI